jgi:hypothetical protein
MTYDATQYTFPDVTDRLAYLNFVHGALAYTLATDLDKWDCLSFMV